MMNKILTLSNLRLLIASIGLICWIIVFNKWSLPIALAAIVCLIYTEITSSKKKDNELLKEVSKEGVYWKTLTPMQNAHMVLIIISMLSYVMILVCIGSCIANNYL